MDGNGFSPADYAAMNGGNTGAMGGGWFWIICLFFLFFGFGGRGANYATCEDVNAIVNNQTTQNGLQNVLLSSANNNYETARLVTGQTEALMAQNNTNLINAIQGFNAVNNNLTAQGNQISQAICNLGYQLNECCCSIKTTMLQDRLADKQADLVAAQAIISNSEQSQYLLGQMGKWVANAPATTTTTT